MPYEYKEHTECRGCKYMELDAVGGDSWHCSLDLSMLGKEKEFIDDLKDKCGRTRSRLEE